MIVSEGAPRTGSLGRWNTDIGKGIRVDESGVKRKADGLAIATACLTGIQRAHRRSTRCSYPATLNV